MDVIGGTSSAKALTACVARDGGEIGVERGANLRIEDRPAVFGGENDVDKNEGERLGHGGILGRAFSPWGLGGW